MSATLRRIRLWTVLGSSLAAAIVILWISGLASFEEHNPEQKAALSPSISPSPDLTPGDVVRIQLEALRHNDPDDRGIEIVYRFTSPNNRLSTGPLRRFARMIKTSPYRSMLNFESVRYQPIEINGQRAYQRVTLRSRQGLTTYLFYLSKQRIGRWADCWLTDSVIVEKPSGYGT